ncbi:MAG: peptide-methionine (R)-S-oxide reductase MsrB [Pseudobacteriovorax sp.]|nr:peptide-methionine (R)-S-oxide reductase MsrB [Pseudobacteriovorax sp.]
MENNNETRDESYWREKLTPEEYHILREKGTERPFSGEYNEVFAKGVWRCKACGTALFDGDTKFATSCGWPAFHSAKKGQIDEHEDLSHGMRRTEVTCHNCQSHLGHVFNDGPPPSGLRYCINSLCLILDEDDSL